MDKKKEIDKVSKIIKVIITVIILLKLDMKKYLKVVFIILLITKGAASFGQTVINLDSIRAANTFPKFADQFGISLIRLIATPEKFDGKTMQVIGFLNLDREAPVIFLHKEDYENYINGNSILIDLSGDFTKTKNLSNYDKKYVIIEGTFEMDKRGRFQMYGGTISNITRIDEWIRRK
ncbi:hypothetical protein [Rubrolithibacter danxiaensis]|uniref:hypothetical protein n=1 Tax=Rubrolithibacter danxiaensis TaxID=3390805 RepID=UPI003BF7A704